MNKQQQQQQKLKYNHLDARRISLGSEDRMETDHFNGHLASCLSVIPCLSLKA